MALNAGIELLLDNINQDLVNRYCCISVTIHLYELCFWNQQVLLMIHF